MMQREKCASSTPVLAGLKENSSSLLMAWKWLKNKRKSSVVDFSSSYGARFGVKHIDKTLKQCNVLVCKCVH